jgi:hypothetical protein
MMAQLRCRFKRRAPDLMTDTSCVSGKNEPSPDAIIRP